MSKLSVVISAYNEEKNLKGCLESVKDLADEIIVVDNSSTDKTSEIARNYTTKVFIQENNPLKIDFQKNFGFSKAVSEWILSLDADERLTPELKEEIKQALDGRSSVLEEPRTIYNGYLIPRKNIIFGKWIKSDTWWPDYQVKLFRKGKGKFSQNSVHKKLDIEGEVRKLENPLTHQNYTSVSQFITKLNNYTDIEAQSQFLSGYKFSWIDSVKFPVDDFLKTFFLEHGYREGLHGLVLSILQAFYMEIVFVKLWEKEKFKEVEVDNFIGKLKNEFNISGTKFKYWLTTALIYESKNPFKKLALRATRKIVTRKIKES